jgi:hypothetical protein
VHAVNLIDQVEGMEDGGEEEVVEADGMTRRLLTRANGIAAMRRKDGDLAFGRVLRLGLRRDM